MRTALISLSMTSALVMAIAAQPTLSKPASLQMAYDAGDSGITGSGPYSVTIDVEGENGGLITSTGFARWWGAEIVGLSGGETLNFTITGFGAPDEIRPVWSTSTDGTNYTDPTRVSATPNSSAAGGGYYNYTFTLVVPASVTHLRIWKYYPYPISSRDAFLASLPAVDPAGPVRFNGSIGSSTEGRDIMMIELSNGSDDTGKRRVWIHAAIHCSETTSYFVVEGLVDFLLNSGSFEAQSLLDNAIINIVPMLNPDGVARGNYRAGPPNGSNPSGADMESRYNIGGVKGFSDYAECRVVMEQIASWNGWPDDNPYTGTANDSSPPTANPVEVVLNLHSTHGSGYPYHFQHVGTYPPSGVISEINQLEGDWIAAFMARSPNFVGFGSTASSTLGASRPYIEATMHDLYSNNVSYTGPNIMAITYEGTYTFGPSPSAWNTDDDYRENGAHMALALLDYLGFPAPVGLSLIGTN